MATAPVAAASMLIANPDAPATPNAANAQPPIKAPIAATSMSSTAPCPGCSTIRLATIPEVAPSNTQQSSSIVLASSRARRAAATSTG
jgi:hypothetical protein